MKLDLEKRIERLEERKKPRTISTLLDLIVHVEDHPDEEAELSPELQELVDKASRVKLDVAPPTHPETEEES